MRITRTEGGLELAFGGAVVAQAAVVDRSVEPVEAVSWDEAVAASASYPGTPSHPFPICFACGTERPDGLRIFPGEVSLRARRAGPGWPRPGSPTARCARTTTSTTTPPRAPAWPPPGRRSTASAAGPATSPSG